MQLELQLSQKQQITQKMLQTLHLLEMNTLQLESYIEQLALENPLLELQDSGAGRAALSSELARQAKLQRQLDWLSQADRQNRVYYEADHADSSEDSIPDYTQQEETLADYLRAQLLLNSYSTGERRALDFLLASIDARGYLNESAEEVAARFALPLPTVKQLFQDIRNLDPAGVGARDLKDCLLLQLSRRPEHAPLTELLVREHLPDIAKHHLSLLARKLQESPEAIVRAVAEIQSLNPKPGGAFSDRIQLPYIHPDLIVIKLEDHFEILVNEYQYPRFTLNKSYLSMAENPPDKETGRYLKEKLRQAKAVQNDLAGRSSTLSALSRVLVERQNSFFRLGPGHKRPLKLSELSEALSLHESTISRALSNKFLQCSWGVFPLNYFLSSVAAIDQHSGIEKTPEQVQQQIQEIIDAEDKTHPLSDEKIRAVLARSGIVIARRTVNKYRQLLGIPDRGGRRLP